MGRNKVLKYELVPADKFGPHTVRMPRSARILHVDLQLSPYGSGVMAWCEVVTTEYQHDRTFILIATGEEIPEGGRYLKTVQFPSGTVWHLFELL
jgi:hypothetical protein